MLRVDLIAGRGLAADEHETVLIPDGADLTDYFGSAEVTMARHRLISRMPIIGFVPLTELVFDVRDPEDTVHGISLLNLRRSDAYKHLGGSYSLRLRQDLDYSAH